MHPALIAEYERARPPRGLKRKACERGDETGGEMGEAEAEGEEEAEGGAAATTELVTEAEGYALHVWSKSPTGYKGVRRKHNRFEARPTRTED